MFVRLILVHNPKAGDESHSRKHLETVLNDAGHDVVYASVKDDGWSDVLDEPHELVVVAGGDGAVSETFIALSGEPSLATLIPIGSANNIARTLGFPSADPERLVAGWPTAARHRYDVCTLADGEVNASFVESAGGGLFADVLARAESRNSPDDKVLQGLRLLRAALDDAPAREWELTIDDVHVSETLLGLEVMNIRELGPNIPLAPEADPGDGLLDVVFVRPEQRAALAEYVDQRLTDGHAEPPTFDVRRGRDLSVRAPESSSLRLDDELLEDADASGHVFSCRPHLRIDVLVPKIDGR